MKVKALHKTGTKVPRVLPENNVLEVTKEDDVIEFMCKNQLHFTSEEVLREHTKEVS